LKEAFKDSTANRRCPLHRVSEGETECLLMVNDPPYGNERSCYGPRLTIITDGFQEL
jgi:hypothetical protein